MGWDGVEIDAPRGLAKCGSHTVTPQRVDEEGGNDGGRRRRRDGTPADPCGQPR